MNCVIHGCRVTPSSCFTLSAFSDADWAGEPHDWRSTSSVCVCLGSNLLTWIAKKQPLVAEYSFALAALEITWLWQLLTDLGISSSSLPVLYCGNQSALSLVSNLVFHARTKHIEIDYHFVWEKVVNKELTIHFLTSEQQVADIFIKALCSPRFLQLCSKLQPCDLPLSLRGQTTNNF